MDTDDLLDDILETTPEDYDREDSEERKMHEEAEEADNAHARRERGEDDDEPPIAADGPPRDDEEVEASADRDDDNQESEREEEASAEDEEEDPVAKQNEGLRKELVRLRKELASRPPAAPVAPAVNPAQLQQPVAVPPAPGAPQAPAPQQTTQVPVQVSEDGRQVYVNANDPMFTEAIRQEAARLVEQSRQPSPQEQMLQANTQATSAFISEAPDRHRGVVERAQALDDYMSLNVQNLLAQGYKFNSVDEVVGVMNDLGITQQAAQLFPDVEQTVGIGTFVQGMASGHPAWRTQIYRQMSSSAPNVQQRQSGLREQLASRRKQPGAGVLEGAPPSMARRGGTRTSSGTTDEKEFAALEQEFENNVLFFPDDKYNRLKTLGKKLDKPGWARSDR